MKLAQGLLYQNHENGILNLAAAHRAGLRHGAADPSGGHDGRPDHGGVGPSVGCRFDAEDRLAERAGRADLGLRRDLAAVAGSAGSLRADGCAVRGRRSGERGAGLVERGLERIGVHDAGVLRPAAHTVRLRRRGQKADLGIWSEELTASS